MDSDIFLEKKTGRTSRSSPTARCYWNRAAIAGLLIFASTYLACFGLVQGMILPSLQQAEA